MWSRWMERYSTQEIEERYIYMKFHLFIYLFCRQQITQILEHTHTKSGNENWQTEKITTTNKQNTKCDLWYMSIIIKTWSIVFLPHHVYVYSIERTHTVQSAKANTECAKYSTSHSDKAHSIIYPTAMLGFGMPATK